MTKTIKHAVRGAGRVGFLARQEGIKKMVEAGHPLLTVYQEYEKDLSISYSQFVKYIHKYIRRKSDGNEGKKITPAKETTPIRTRTSDQPAFVSSPTPRDDLIHPKPKG